MNVNVGEIVYEQILSLDVDNNPITGATFDSVLYYNNSTYTGTSPSYALTDGSRGIFTFSWSGDVFGQYQLYVKNNSTNVIFVSDVVEIGSTSDTTIYIGL
jgi:hypothetical protein